MQQYFDKSGEFYVRLLRKMDNTALSRQVDREQAIAVVTHLHWMSKASIYSEYFENEHRAMLMYDCVNNAIIALRNKSYQQPITLPTGLVKTAEAVLDLFQLYKFLQ